MIGPRAQRRERLNPQAEFPPGKPPAATPPGSLRHRLGTPVGATDTRSPRASRWESRSSDAAGAGHPPPARGAGSADSARASRGGPRPPPRPAPPPAPVPRGQAARQADARSARASAVWSGPEADHSTESATRCASPVAAAPATAGLWPPTPRLWRRGHGERPAPPRVCAPRTLGRTGARCS